MKNEKVGEKSDNLFVQKSAEKQQDRRKPPNAQQTEGKQNGNVEKRGDRRARNSHGAAQGGRRRTRRGGAMGTGRGRHEKGEFDFASSNAKFDKIELVKQLGQLNLEETEKQEVAAYYNPTTSFFDDISCESKERQQQDGKLSTQERRARQHQERRVNLETFGQTSVDSGRGRGRPRRHKTD